MGFTFLGSAIIYGVTTANDYVPPQLGDCVPAYGGYDYDYGGPPDYYGGYGGPYYGPYYDSGLGFKFYLIIFNYPVILDKSIFRTLF